MSVHYVNFSKYLKSIVDEKQIFLEVKCIKNILFIEKIEFMELENSSYLRILNEIMKYKDAISIKTFKAKFNGENLSPIVTRFRYTVEDEKILFYTRWIDSDRVTFNTKT